MNPPEHPVPPPGRGATRWFLFLAFAHLLPVPWYLAVAAGLAPASFLFAAGMTSLFLPDGDSLAFAALLLAPALVAGILFLIAAWRLSLALQRLSRPLVRTLVLAAVLAACLAAALNPIFVAGGHSGTEAFGLLGFPEVLAQVRIPPAVSSIYFAGLAALLLGLLAYQHRAAGRPPLAPAAWQRRRRIRRRLLAAGLAGLVAGLLWTHRVPLVVKPLADLGMAGAQYRLAMALQAQSAKGSGAGSGYHDWLVRAAQQGHRDAVRELARHPRSREERLRWLPVAAENGDAEAQYALYRMLLAGEPPAAIRGTARDWLEKAAASGHGEAQYELGRHFAAGHAGLGIARDSAASRKWWESAAAGGQGRAMEELAWRYLHGADGFPRDPRRGVDLLQRLADGYRLGLLGLPPNDALAAGRRAQAAEAAALEDWAARGDHHAQATLGRRLLQAPGATPETTGQALAMLEKAAAGGDAELQHELGGIYIFGRHGQTVDLPRGRGWWARALAQNHIRTMEFVAPAYQTGQFGYPVNLLQSKALVQRLVDAYRDGTGRVGPNPARERYWSAELKHFDRLFDLAGGTYRSPDGLRPQAEAGDPGAQYQLGRQMMAGGPAEQRRQGLAWIERAAEGGHAEAQYRLVTFFDRESGIMQRDPARGLALLQAAAAQDHLPAMGALALAYRKGRYGLAPDLVQARHWYERLLAAHASGRYQGEIDGRFMTFQRQQLTHVTRSLEGGAMKGEAPRRRE